MDATSPGRKTKKAVPEKSVPLDLAIDKLASSSYSKQKLEKRSSP
jgi:hypothetical protein